MIAALSSWVRLLTNAAVLAWYIPTQAGLSDYARESQHKCMVARVEINAALRDLGLSWVAELELWGKR
jgi:hypothetical protein